MWLREKRDTRAEKSPCRTYNRSELVRIGAGDGPRTCVAAPFTSEVITARNQNLSSVLRGCYQSDMAQIRYHFIIFENNM